jgi:hypothetical protein
MEIKRKVRVEDGGREIEAGATSGPRTTTQVPPFTKAERDEQLGKVTSQMKTLFRPWRRHLVGH